MVHILSAVWVILSSYMTYAPHYREGMMEQVARNRGMEIVDCMVSSPIEPLGSWVYVESQVTGFESWCRVTDVSAPEHRDSHIAKNRMLEFGWSITPQMCGISYVAQEPPEKCPVIVSHRVNLDFEGMSAEVYKTWQLLHLQLVYGNRPRIGFVYQSIAWE